MNESREKKKQSIKTNQWEEKQGSDSIQERRIFCIAPMARCVLVALSPCPGEVWFDRLVQAAQSREKQN